ncbi:MAG: ribbon-helix-helix protein, CopG family [Waterburya sp.]
MNFSVDLKDELARKLEAIAKKEQVSRNSLIAEAVSLLIKERQSENWSEEILNWQGCPEFELPDDN